MRVEGFLRSSAGRLPDKVALVAAEGRFTYAEIARQSETLARFFEGRRVRRGDRVAIYAGNRAASIVSAFAALEAGAAFVMINPGTKPDKLGYLLRDSGARALVAEGAALAACAGALASARNLSIVVALDGVPEGLPVPPPAACGWEDALAANVAPSRRRERPAIDLDLAALIYTSGSTGRPKGVMMTHLNVVSAATSITTYLRNAEDDVILDVLPLSFDYGLYQVLMAFQMGATVVLESGFAYPHAILERLAAERVTGFPIVPTISAHLLRMDLSSYDVRTLRYITSTGQNLPPEHIARLRAAFPHVRIYSMYGLTECKRVAYLEPEEIDRRPASVGKAMPNVEVYLVDASGRRLGPGSTGELIVRGANVMKGYWRAPRETARVLAPGPLPGERVLRTGDIFRMDDEGFLYFVGRRDDLIKSRGEKVSPKEVENVLTAMDGIAMAAVFGVPDAILGQAVKAIVVPAPGAALSERDVRRHCARHLEEFMVPKEVEMRDSLPQTASGKIDRRALAAEEAARR